MEWEWGAAASQPTNQPGKPQTEPQDNTKDPEQKTREPVKTITLVVDSQSRTDVVVVVVVVVVILSVPDSREVNLTVVANEADSSASLGFLQFGKTWLICFICFKK